MEHEFYECPEYLSNTPAEVDRPEEFEYEVNQYGATQVPAMTILPQQLYWQVMCLLVKYSVSYLFTKTLITTKSPPQLIMLLEW